MKSLLALATALLLFTAIAAQSPDAQAAPGRSAGRESARHALGRAWDATA